MTLDEIRKKLADSVNEKSELPKTLAPYEQIETMINLKKDHRIIYQQTALECPKCGCGEMHHYKIEVFNRPEDSTGDHITIFNQYSFAWQFMESYSPYQLSIDDDLKNNPSSRRSGVLITLICEQCGEHLHFGIGQHQGSTMVGWK